MRMSENCARCLYRKQEKRTNHKECLAKMKVLLDHRPEDATSPYMLYLFDQVYEQYVGKKESYMKIKKKYNDLVLSMEDEIRKRIEDAEEPLKTALFLARIGNYIDFGAMTQVDSDIFLELFSKVQISESDEITYQSFFDQCSKAKTFLLLADNCGEIVLDKLLVEQLKKRFPELKVAVMVRGGEVLNDATKEDAVYVGMDQVAEVVSNGKPVPGTVYELLSEEAKELLDHADVILSKGQGNYESLSNQGRHIFFTFLCKCDQFTERFGVPELTGMFVEEC